MLSKRASSLVKNAVSKTFAKKFPIRAYLAFCKAYKLQPLEHSLPKLYEQLRQYSIFRIQFIGASGNSVASDIADIESYLAAEGIHSDAKNWKPMKKLLAELISKYPSKDQTKRAFRTSELVMIFDKLMAICHEYCVHETVDQSQFSKSNFHLSIFNESWMVLFAKRCRVFFANLELSSSQFLVNNNFHI